MRGLEELGGDLRAAVVRVQRDEHVVLRGETVGQLGKSDHAEDGILVIEA